MKWLLAQLAVKVESLEVLAKALLQIREGVKLFQAQEALEPVEQKLIISWLTCHLGGLPGLLLVAYLACSCSKCWSQAIGELKTLSHD